MLSSKSTSSSHWSSRCFPPTTNLKKWPTLAWSGLRPVLQACHPVLEQFRSMTKQEPLGRMQRWKSPASKVKLVFPDANIFFLNHLCLPRKVDQPFEELKQELHESANLARLLDAFYEKSNLVENETSVFHTFSFCLWKLKLWLWKPARQRRPQTILQRVPRDLFGEGGKMDGSWKLFGCEVAMTLNYTWFAPWSDCSENRVARAGVHIIYTYFHPNLFGEDFQWINLVDGLKPAPRLWLQASVPLRLATISPTSTVPQSLSKVSSSTLVSKVCLNCKSSWSCIAIWWLFSVPCWWIASFQIHYWGMLCIKFTWGKLSNSVLRPNKSTYGKNSNNPGPVHWHSLHSGAATPGINEVKSDRQLELMLDQYLDFWGWCFFCGWWF